jgi:hypothetical protein
MIEYHTTADLRAALATQLYDEWHGHYLLMQVLLGQYVPVRELTRAEAMTYRTRPTETLRIVTNKLEGKNEQRLHGTQRHIKADYQYRSARCRT